MFSDAESNKQLKVLTNNFTPPALTIPQMYKQRRQVDTHERCALSPAPQTVVARAMRRMVYDLKAAFPPLIDVAR